MDATGRNHGNTHSLRQFDRRLKIYAAHHAVAPDVGIDDCLNAIAFEFLRQIDDVVP